MIRPLAVTVLLLAAAACTGNGKETVVIRALTAQGGDWTATTFDYREYQGGDWSETLVTDLDLGGQVAWRFTQVRNETSAAYFSDWRTGEVVSPDGWAAPFDWDVTNAANTSTTGLWLYLYEDAVLRSGEWDAALGQVDTSRAELTLRRSESGYRFEADVVLER